MIMRIAHINLAKGYRGGERQAELLIRSLESLDVEQVLIARANETYLDPGDIAELYVRAGLVDEALHWLDKAVTNGSLEETWIAFWPHWDVLRDDPRYKDLVIRVYGEKLGQEILSRR